MELVNDILAHCQVCQAWALLEVMDLNVSTTPLP